MSASKKLIDTINDAILTGTNGNSSINEQSFLSHLLTNRRGKFFFSKKQKQGEEWTSFLMTRWILRFIRKFVMVAIWAIHVELYLMVSKNKSRICTIWKTIQSWFKKDKTTKEGGKRWAQVKDIDKQKVRSLLDVQSSPVINFSVIAAVFIICISFIVKTVTFAIKDYMFLPLNMRVNEQGVLTIDQPCLESHSFFLLNASTFLWPTGINVNEGDKVTFSVSGSMYSDIGEMYRAARDNKKLLYPRARIVSNKNSQDNEGVNYCIYNGLTNCSRIQSKDAWFGTLLCQVSDEHLPPTNSSRQHHDPIVQITQKTNSFKANRGGMLFLTFNDVLLTRKTVIDLLTDQSVDAKTMQEDLIDSEFFTPQKNDGSLDTTFEVRIKRILDYNEYTDMYKSNILLLYSKFFASKEPNDSPNKYYEIFSAMNYKNIYKNNLMHKLQKCSLNKAVNDFYDSVHPDPTIWFKDNAGEYLVNIRVERNIWKSRLSLPKKIAMSILREFEHASRLDSKPCHKKGFWHSNVPIMIDFFILYFIIEIIVSHIVLRRQRVQTKILSNDISEKPTAPEEQGR